MNDRRMWIEERLHLASQHENTEPLDEDGILQLHLLVADAYSMGWNEGASVIRQQATYRRLRPQNRDEEQSRSAVVEKPVNLLSVDELIKVIPHYDWCTDPDDTWCCCCDARRTLATALLQDDRITIRRNDEGSPQTS